MGSERLSEPTDRLRKSLSTETTFTATGNEAELLEICNDLCRDLGESLREESLKGRLLTLKTKTDQFEVKTKAVRLAGPTDCTDVIQGAACKALRAYLEANSRLFLDTWLGTHASDIVTRHGYSRDQADFCPCQ